MKYQIIIMVTICKYMKICWHGFYNQILFILFRSWSNMTSSISLLPKCIYKISSLQCLLFPCIQFLPQCQVTSDLAWWAAPNKTQICKFVCQNPIINKNVLLRLIYLRWCFVRPSGVPNVFSLTVQKPFLNRVYNRPGEPLRSDC